MSDAMHIPRAWVSCPFYCGTQASDWESRNCFDCQHGDRGSDAEYRGDAEYEWGRCAIRDAVVSAHFGEWDPTVNLAMGHDGGIHPPEWCASREVAS